MKGLVAQYPYVSEEEIRSLWNQSRAIAIKNGARGSTLFHVMAKITKSRARKRNEERLKRDHKAWLEEQKRKHEGDWE